MSTKHIGIFQLNILAKQTCTGVLYIMFCCYWHCPVSGLRSIVE